MFISNSTIECYEECLKRGFCEVHKKELEGLDFGNDEAQRRAFLYLRLQIFKPLLFHKPFTLDKMKGLFVKHSFYGQREDPESDPEFLVNIIYLDAIMVYTLCYFAKICCPGIFFKQNNPDYLVHCKEKKDLLDILRKREIDRNEIELLGSLLKKAFDGKKEDLYNIGYVSAILSVKNESSRIDIKTAIVELDKELNNIPRECKRWHDTGFGAKSQMQYEEAIKAYTSGLQYSTYAFNLLLDRAEVYLETKNYKEAALDSYKILMTQPRSMQLQALIIFASALSELSLFEECRGAVHYGTEIIDDFKNKEGGKDKVEIMKTCLNRISLELAKKLKELPEKKPADTCEAEEKKDIPELIEASDTESEEEDVPDLEEASYSDSSNYDDEYCTPEPNIKATIAENHVDIKDEGECSEDKKVKRLLTEASQNLQNGFRSALGQYREALDKIKASPKVHEYSEIDIVCIKYALGTSYYKSGGYDDLQKAISTFKGIAEDHGSISFPAAYYGIALANQKLNRFKEALHYLQIVDDIQATSLTKCYTWPESSATIEETKADHLKSLVNTLMGECENPPSPEATCRFHDCAFQPAIYYAAPDFKGLFAMQCSSHCTLQFHPHCWKLLKTEKHFSDKEFLDQRCITPDCDGLIIKIENIDNGGDVKRVFESSAESKKSTKKKTKLEKKLEGKEEKRRKRKDSSGRPEAASEGTNEPPETTKDAAKENGLPNETQPNSNHVRTEMKELYDGPGTFNETPVYPETFTVIKKEKIVDEIASKTSSKVKEHKKSKNTISIDEFLLDSSDTYGSGNEYQQRISSLQQDKENACKKEKPNNILKPTAPVFEPQRLINLAPISAAYGLDDFPQIPIPTSTTPNDTNQRSESASPTVNTPTVPPQPEFIVESAKKNIYSYLKNFLQKCGPLKEDDPILVRELQGFPGEANALIADCGGLGKFLQQSVDFAFVGEEYVCTADQITKAYDMKNNADLSAKYSSTDGGYCSYSSVEKDFNDYGDSGLNPDAQEYSPQVAKSGRNSPHLMSAISKLRQPLTVDESANGMDNHDLSNHVDSSSVNAETPKVPTRLQLARLCADAVKGYFSADASDHRSYIRQVIQPYAIVEVNKKSNKNVQTDNNENTKKTDNELQRLQEVVSFLSDENVTLKEENELLKEQHTMELDRATKCKMKSSVEVSNLKKDLEEAKLTKEEQAKAFKAKESKLEKEIKFLHESLKKYRDEESAHKSGMDSLQAANKNLKLSLTQAEDRINLLLNEKRIIKTTLDLEIEKLKNNVKNLQSDKIKSLKRAKDAELKLLHVQRIEYLRRIDGKAAEAVKRINDLQKGMASSTLDPVITQNFIALLTQINSYVSKLGTTRIEFTSNIDDHINSVKNGTPLEALQPLEIKELPEIPSWSTQQTMQNGPVSSAQSSSWNLNPMDMIRSALNQIPGNSYFRMPNNTPQMPIGTPSSGPQMPIGTPSVPQMPIGTPANQQAYSYMNNQGAIPKINQQGNQKKLPPGLTDPQSTFKSTESAKVPEISQPVPKKQPVAVQPSIEASQSKAKEEKVAKPKQSSSGTKSLGGSTHSLASGSSKSALDIKKSCDSLELDYNVKKSPPKATKLPETAAPAPTSSKASSKKSYEKLMQRLRVIYPEVPQAQLTILIKEFRSQKSSLSGLTIDMIITEIVAMYEAKKKEEMRKAAEIAQKMRKVPTKPLVNKKLSEDLAKEANEMNAKGQCAWGVSGGDASKQWRGKDFEDACTICFEEMTPKTACKVDCGHTFHLTCVKEWINKNSTCPICRLHVLLPEDYPAL